MAGAQLKGITYGEQTKVGAVLIDSVDEVRLLESHPAGNSAVSVVVDNLELLAVVADNGDAIGTADQELRSSSSR